MLSDNYRLTFSVTPPDFEVYEEEIEQNKLKEHKRDPRKDVWISLYDHYRLGMRYDTPIKDPDIQVWIRKSFNYQYSSDVLLFMYELYSKKLFLISPTAGNFTCHKIFDHCKSIGCGNYSYIGCEISDVKGDIRKFYKGRIGLEDRTIFDLLRFLQSLKCYNDWKDYDQFQELYKSSGVSEAEIEKLLTNEISDLGIIRET
jgi:hypothetical protein